MRLGNVINALILVVSPALLVGVTACGASCRGTVTNFQLLAPSEAKLTVSRSETSVCYVNGHFERLSACQRGTKYPDCAR